jgi:3-oxoacyl-[acyl-carrier protein] reductase
MRLKGKAALVTGAGGGLGGAIAKRFAAEGASVLCTDRDLARAEATVSAIAEAGGTASVYLADIAEAGDCEAQVAETVQRYGRIDIAVNNAGVGLHRLALDTSAEDWDRVLRINLTGSFLTAQAAARRMVAQGGGRIIQIGSISGQRGNMGGVEAVANAALFLASDECQWITGHVLNVDGGYGAAGIAYDPAEIAVP